MTEEQMRERIKEIETERDKLRAEQKEYEQYFYDKKQNEAMAGHKQHVGKCFITKDLPTNENKHIKAFKILEICDVPNEHCAVCIALVDGSRKSRWNEYGIEIMTLRVWGYNQLRLMLKESDPKMIDFYKEISQEEFESLYRDYNNRLDDALFK